MFSLFIDGGVGDSELKCIQQGSPREMVGLSKKIYSSQKQAKALVHNKFTRGKNLVTSYEQEEEANKSIRFGLDTESTLVMVNCTLPWSTFPSSFQTYVCWTSLSWVAILPGLGWTNFQFPQSEKFYYPDVCQKCKTCICLDHFPILLVCVGIQRGCRYFKFENMRLKSEGFVKRVRQQWFAYQFYSTSSYTFAAKLRALKKYLKTVE